MHLQEGGRRGAAAGEDESVAACSAESLPLITNDINQHVTSFHQISRASADPAQQTTSRMHTLLLLLSGVQQGELRLFVTCCKN